jgi:Nucleotidyl transferase AbiEii toxin, Type IV TA system
MKACRDDYVMQPFELKLSYRHQSWLTLEFELGHEEIGSTENPTFVLADELIEMFDDLGLPAPSAVPLLATEHQIAQKLHACTTPNRHDGNDRAHDLVDLQLLIETDPPDQRVLPSVGRRHFVARSVAP